MLLLLTQLLLSLSLGYQLSVSLNIVLDVTCLLQSDMSNLSQVTLISSNEKPQTVHFVTQSELGLKSI